MVIDASDSDPNDSVTIEIEDAGDVIDASIPVGASMDSSSGSDAPRIPDELPILPLRDSVVFPGTIVPIKVVREKVHRVLDAALGGSRIVCAVPQRHRETEDPTLDDLYRVGTACAILKLVKLEDGCETIIVHGIARVGIVDIKQESPFWTAAVQPRRDEVEPSKELEALVHTVRETARRAVELSPNVPDGAMGVIDTIPSPGGLADFLAANLSLGLVEKQEMLETFSVKDRLMKVNAAVLRQVEILEMSQKIQSQVRDQMDQSQREYYLREQLRAIQQELGMSDARGAELKKLRERAAEAKMPEAVDKVAQEELDRLEVIPQASPEYSLSMDYLGWLCSLPWAIQTDDQLDIKRAARILDKDHYGLQKIKNRILEFLAVLKLNPDGRGPILCFSGPPGVGKTSLGRSVARALGRKFIRMSLGGARDEADIRGHRRTYVGAMPGRIIQEIRKAGSNNPVFMLDEVDKLGADFRGDPASALLEVLDPAQNNAFTDHYLDVPFDLSDTMFIATANYMDAIPPPLRDRMEVIELPGYTQREKLEIAKRYLVPRQLEENGLKKLAFDDDALREIISGYTREAGVRELERKIGAICRSRAKAIVEGSRRSLRVTGRSLEKDLGSTMYESEVADERSVPGVVTGLAFTPVGGEILFVEATRMVGSGQLKLTGQIGDVMRESAMAAFSIVRTRAAEWGVDPADLLKSDIHIHVPAGAIPKDGPSAGVAMVAALASLLSDKAVDPLTGMTGEITLRGRVMPVGGVREKVLGAHRAGLTRVLLPTRNVRDLDDIPEDIRNQIEFVPIKSVDALLKVVFSPASSEAKPKRKPKRRKSPKLKSSRKPSRKSKSSSARRKRKTPERAASSLAAE
jgi:ATP-dependent Lon protease